VARVGHPEILFGVGRATAVTGVNRYVEIPFAGGADTVWGPSIPGVSGQLVWAYTDFVDAVGTQFATDTNNSRIIVIPSGSSSGTAWDPVVSSAGLNGPGEATTDDAGNIYIADYGNARVLKVVRTGTAPPASALSVTNSPSGTFVQGGSGTFNITETNNGPGATSGTVTVGGTVGLMPLGNFGGPTGTVRFLDGYTLLGSGTVTAGVATYQTSALAVGTSINPHQDDRYANDPRG
jgi:hypothetical protein